MTRQKLALIEVYHFRLYEQLHFACTFNAVMIWAEELSSCRMQIICKLLQGCRSLVRHVVVWRLGGQSKASA